MGDATSYSYAEPRNVPSVSGETTICGLMSMIEPLDCVFVKLEET